MSTQGILGDFGRPFFCPDFNAIPVGAGLPAKIVNDNAVGLVSRVALQSFAGKPAPTGEGNKSAHKKGVTLAGHAFFNRAGC
ncbi:hypothetical protein [Pseudomonas fluorescens]|uniref:hypothetical protein n=1 Tax=Pseudomonas fluorescens TaxID=294 RepID=UPI0009B89CA5|nr:hypothetical protein [Pseudomonas fluorescens]